MSGRAGLQTYGKPEMPYMPRLKIKTAIKFHSAIQYRAPSEFAVQCRQSTDDAISDITGGEKRE